MNILGDFRIRLVIAPKMLVEDVNVQKSEKRGINWSRLRRFNELCLTKFGQRSVERTAEAVSETVSEAASKAASKAAVNLFGD